MAFTPASCGSDSELSSIVDQLSHKQLAMDPHFFHCPTSLTASNVSSQSGFLNLTTRNELDLPHHPSHDGPILIYFSDGDSRNWGAKRIPEP